MNFFSKKNLIIITIIGFVFWICGALLGSKIATRTHPQNIPSSEKYFPQPVEKQSFTSFDRVRISSWFIPNESSEKAIILLNGIGGNRLGVVSRAQFYLEKGFNVLMPDLRGTGASGGDLISFGWNERYDLLACVDFLKERGLEKIAVHGISLGAATIVYSFQENPDYEFVVLESCYDNITNALKNRVDKLDYYTKTKRVNMDKFEKMRSKYWELKAKGKSPKQALRIVERRFLREEEVPAESPFELESLTDLENEPQISEIF